MPIKRAAYKHLRKSKLKHFKNISIVSELKTLAKKIEKLVSGKKLEEAKKLGRILASKIDRAASKGVVHRNTASRKIARLMRKISLAAKT